MKQRLLGAVILAALLVILVPELLDGAGHKSRHAKQLDIPEEPVFQPMPAFPKLAEMPVIKTQVKPVSKDVQEKNKKPPQLHSWVLQVGSFNNPENAKQFQDKLRAQSYTAFIDIKKTATKKTWRVRIGPELDKTRLQKLKKRFLKQYDIKAMIVKQR